MTGESGKMGKVPALAIVGPTAAGKSALALALAQKLPAEIVCMDSMQVYRRMDIGTAKPTRQEQAMTPHHMLDLVEPTEAFSVSQYVDRVQPVLHDIHHRGKLPLLVGGTGLYLKALTQGLPLGGATGSEAIRQQLHAIAEEAEGNLRLHAMLQEVDPDTARRLHPNDLRRVIRALEVYQATGMPMSRQNETASDSAFQVALLGAAFARDVLYRRTDHRVEEMMRMGLLGEVEALVKSGVGPGCQSMQGIGYKELVPMLEGKLSKEEAVCLMKRNTRRYAKRQCTWFAANKDIHWLDMGAAEAIGQGIAFAKRFWETRTL